MEETVSIIVCLQLEGTKPFLKTTSKVGMKTSVKIDLLYIRRHELGNRIFQFEMHSLPAFVMWDDKRSQVG